MDDFKTKLAKIEAQLVSTNTCSTLTTHVLQIVSEFDAMEIPETLGESVHWGIEIWTKAKPLGLHTAMSDKICEDHSVNNERKTELIRDLELLSIIYCFYTLYPLVFTEFSNELKKLKKIASAAKKLRELIPDGDSDLFGLIQLIDNVERKSFESANTEIFFSTINANLQALEDLKDLIPQTAFGQLTKLNAKSPKGNIAIRIWIISIYGVWTQNLNRNLQYDGPNGVNGPARFTEFAFDALSPLHPSIEHSQIVYAVRAFRNQTPEAHALLKPKTLLSSS